MAVAQLNLEKGKWVVANCGKHPSDKNCKAVFMAPENQRQELINIVTDHAVKLHGHKNTPELAQKISQLIESITVT